MNSEQKYIVIVVHFGPNGYSLPATTQRAGFGDPVVVIQARCGCPNCPSSHGSIQGSLQIAGVTPAVDFGLVQHAFLYEFACADDAQAWAEENGHHFHICIAAKPC